MAKPTKIPSLEQIRRGLLGSEKARERMHERLWNLRYGGPKLSVSFSRGLLELALLPELDDKGRQRLVVVSANDRALTAAYQQVFEASDSPWTRAAVLESLSNTVSDEYFEMLRRYTPNAQASRTVLPAFDRMRGNWKRLLAGPLHLGVASAIGEMLFFDLVVSGGLHADEGALIAECLGSAALRELPSLEAAQRDEPFFWFQRDGYSDLAALVTPLLQPLGLLPTCTTSQQMLARGIWLQDPYLRMASVVSSLQLSIPVPLEALTKVAEFPATRPGLFAALQHDSETRQQLAEFETPPAKAEGQLAAWMASPWELTRAPYELELQGQRSRETDGGVAHLFVFRFRYEPRMKSRYEEDTWALVGLLPGQNQWFAAVDEPLSKKCLEAALDTAEQSLGERLTQ